MFSEDVIDRIRDRIDIVDLVSGTVSLRKTGKNHVGLCPFHAEKTPSFTVNPDKQIFHCFGCGVGGDVFKFIVMQEGLNFPDAVRQLAGRAGVALPTDSRERGIDKKTGDERKLLLRIIAEAMDFFRSALAGPAGSAARAYLQKRGVSESAIEDFSLGYALPEWDGLLRHLKGKGQSEDLLEKAGLIVPRSSGKGHYDRFRNRIIFPIRDLSGNVIAFGGRVMDEALPKYLNSPETPLYSKSNILYGLDRAKEQGRRQGYFIIVEGYLDAIACHQHGVGNAVATLGTALTEGHLRVMRRFARKVVLIFDPDPAGVKAALRGLDLFITSGMKVNVVSLPQGEDPDTFLHRNGKDPFDACLRESRKLMDFVLDEVARSRPATGIDETVEKASEMLALIARIPSGIERDHYIKKTSEMLEVNETLLRQEMQQRFNKSGGSGQRHAGPSLRPAQRPKAEELLIHLMLTDEGLALDIKEQITPQDLTDPLYQRATERIFEVIERIGKLDIQLLFKDGDEELNRLVSHYSVLDTEYNDPARTGKDCVARIKQHGHARKMKALSVSIKEVEARGDRAGLRKLLEEQQRLLQSRHAVQDEKTVESP